MCYIVSGFTATNNCSVEGILKLKILRMLSICLTNSWHLCVILCILNITNRRVSVSTRIILENIIHVALVCVGFSVKQLIFLSCNAEAYTGEA
jgi:hypothetical protein